MEATTVLIVQHAEKASGSDDPGLTPTGHLQAAACATFLSDLGVAAVYTSPLRRAQETAAIIGSSLSCEAISDSRLSERINWGAAYGLGLTEFLGEWQKTTKDRDYQPPSGDSSRRAGDRCERAVLDIVESHVGSRVVIVAHAGVTADFLRTAVGDDAVRAIAPTIIEEGIPGGAITSIRHADEWQVQSIAQVDHLPEELQTLPAPSTSQTRNGPIAQSPGKKGQAQPKRQR